MRMTKELRRRRRDIMAERPHERVPRVKRSCRCSCPEFCLKHGLFRAKGIKVMMSTILNYVEVGDYVHVFTGESRTRLAVVLDVAQPYFDYRFADEDEVHVGTANTIARLA